MNTTIAISEENYNRLKKVKHNLEDNNGIFSFNKVVGYLLDNEEKKNG